MPMLCHQSPRNEWLKGGQQHLLPCVRSPEKKRKDAQFSFLPLSQHCDATVPWKLWGVSDLCCTDIKSGLEHFFCLLDSALLLATENGGGKDDKTVI